MKIVIRKISQSDVQAAAAIWREVLDVRNATDEIVAETYSVMEQDDRYVTFVAEADGKIAGLAAAVKVLAIGHPGGYVKMNGIGVLPEYRGQGIGKFREIPEGKVRPDLRMFLHPFRREPID